MNRSAWLLMTLVACATLHASPGALDLDFGPGTGADGPITRMDLQPDGKILIAGIFTSYDGVYRPRLARLEVDGRLDTNFVPRISIDSNVHFLQVLPNGKIIVAVDSLHSLYRLNPDGTMDLSYATTMYPNPVMGVDSHRRVVRFRQQSNGFYAERLLENGLADPSYNGYSWSNVDGGGGGGGWTLPFDFGAVGPDDKLTVGGQWSVRFLAHGASDHLYRGTGFRVSLLALRPDGKTLLVVGEGLPGYLPAGFHRLLADGSIDSGFAPARAPRRALAVQPDGRILLDGEARLNVDGSLDPSFAPQLSPTNSVHSIVVRPDGRILIAGSFTNVNGVPQERIAQLYSDAAAAPRIATQPQNQTVVNGRNSLLAVNVTAQPPAQYEWLFNGAPLPGETNSVLRLANAGPAQAGEYRARAFNDLRAITSEVAMVTVLNAPTHVGALDPFAAGSGADSTVRRVAVQPDGKIVIAGWFTKVHGVPSKGVARLNADGSLDPSFDPGSGVDGRVRALAVDHAGNVIVGGSFTNVAGTQRPHLARLRHDGQLDRTFNVAISNRFSDYGPLINSLWVQPDGKILVGGRFNSVNGRSWYSPARLHADGTLDTNFLAYGPALPAPPPPTDTFTVQPDGKVLVAGGSAVSRLLTNGYYDSSFTTLRENALSALAVQHDNRILVGHSGRVLRFMPSGVQDSSFRTNVFQTFRQINDLVQHGCGKILVAGDFLLVGFTNTYHLARLEPDGALDPTFPPQRFDSPVWSLGIEHNNSIIIGGDFSQIDGATRNGIARLYPDATGPPPIYAQPASVTVRVGEPLRLSVQSINCPDVRFQWQRNGTNVPNATNAVFQPSFALPEHAGEYRVVLNQGPGTNISATVTVTVLPERREPGSTDIFFQPPDVQNGIVRAIAVAPDRKVVIGGLWERNNIFGHQVMRLNYDGSADASFMSRRFSAQINAVAVQSDGRVIVGGNFVSGPNLPFGTRIMRLLTNGLDDNSFRQFGASGPSANGSVNAVAVQSDGKILLAGGFTTVNGITRSGIARLQTNSLIDTNFVPDVQASLSAICLQPDGRILIGGDITHSNNWFPVARLHPDGALDASFLTSGGANGRVLGIALGPDGRIVIAGEFTAVGTAARNYVARLHPDGRLDPSFNPGDGPNDPPLAVRVQVDGKVLIAGAFTHVNGSLRYGVARMNVDGSLDLGFEPGEGPNAEVLALVHEPLGDTYVGGAFTEYDGYPREGIARINGDPRLFQAEIINGVFRASFNSIVGRTHVLQFKTNLSDSSWAPVSSLIGNGAVQSLADPEPVSGTRFYRLFIAP